MRNENLKLLMIHKALQLVKAQLLCIIFSPQSKCGCNLNRGKERQHNFVFFRQHMRRHPTQFFSDFSFPIDATKIEIVVKNFCQQTCLILKNVSTASDNPVGRLVGKALFLLTFVENRARWLHLVRF